MLEYTTLPAHESKRLKAVNIALREEIQRLYDADDVLRTIHNPLTCQESWLSVLASILKPLLWSNNLTLMQKRKLLAATPQIRSRAGTLEPVSQVINSMGLVAHLEEWFEFGGEPGYFRIVIESIGSQYSDDDLALLEQLVLLSKRLSAHLLEIQVSATIEAAKLHVGTSIQIFEEVIIA